MDRLLRPERFDVDPNSTDASDSWNHWFLTFTNFLDTIESLKPDKLKTLIHFLSPPVYKFVSGCSDYDTAVCTLKSLYIQPKNEIFSRYLLATCKQNTHESLDQFIQKLRNLAKDCNFKPVSAEQNQEDAIRDAFISGLLSNHIRQRLLEHKTLDARTAFDQAKALDFAQQQSRCFTQTSTNLCGSTAIATPQTVTYHISDQSEPALAAAQTSCFFCGYDRHVRSKCPAREALCKKCGKKGHFQKVCRSTGNTKHTASTSPFLTSAINTAAAPVSLTKAITEVIINGVVLQALVDTGSSESYVSEEIVRQHGWPILKSKNQIILASTSMTSNTKGHCFVSLLHRGTSYQHVKLSILPSLCADVLLGHDFLQRHQTVEIPFQGTKPPFSLCGLSVATLTSVPLFAHLDPSCRPISTKSRRHNHSDEIFIRTEITKLLKDGIIEPSQSPWRAQVLVTTNERHKRRMVVDYKLSTALPTWMPTHYLASIIS